MRQAEPEWAPKRGPWPAAQSRQARLRPGTSLGEGVRIGNFVETKAATIEADVLMPEGLKTKYEGIKDTTTQ
jgi:hypothetical protein